jgi:hypothetical protein
VQEEDPTAIEPNGDESLPEKPPLEIPAEPVAAPTDEEESEVPEEDVMRGEDAADDDSVDDAEEE